jgi:hypothetical protein
MPGGDFDITSPGGPALGQIPDRPARIPVAVVLRVVSP